MVTPSNIDESVEAGIAVTFVVVHKDTVVSAGDRTAVDRDKSRGGTPDIVARRVVRVGEGARDGDVVVTDDGIRCSLVNAEQDAVPLVCDTGITLSSNGVVRHGVWGRSARPCVVEDAQPPGADRVVGDVIRRARAGRGHVFGLDAQAYTCHDIVGDISVEIVVGNDADTPVVRGLANILEAVVGDDVARGGGRPGVILAMSMPA